MKALLLFPLLLLPLLLLLLLLPLLVVVFGVCSLFRESDPIAVLASQVQHADGLRRRRDVRGSRGGKSIQRVFSQRQSSPATSNAEGQSAVLCPLSIVSLIDCCPLCPPGFPHADINQYQTRTPAYPYAP